jgi:hypothetical protein
MPARAAPSPTVGASWRHKKLHHDRVDHLDLDLRDLDGDGEPDKWFEYAIWLMAALALITASFWLAVEIAALLSLHWMPPLAALTATPGVLLKLSNNLASRRSPTRRRSPRTLRPASCSGRC